MMYLNNNSHIQFGLLNGIAVGFLYYDPNQYDQVVEEDEWYEEFNVLLLFFFIKITRW